MTLISGDSTTQLAFSMSENKGVYAVLLGSGISRAAGIPTGWEITMELVRRMAMAAGAGEQADWQAWYVQHTGQQPNYSTLLEQLGTTQTERRSIVQGFLEPNPQVRDSGLKAPTRAHRAVAELVKSGHVRVIITTNFDRLMESALRDIGIEPTVVSTLDTLAGAEPLTHSRCYMLKLHGDYKDARILNTDVELGEYPPQFNGLLDRIIDEFGLIITGWSGEWDHALRNAFYRAPSRRYPTFWLSHAGVTARAKEIVDHRRAIVAQGDADTFFSELQVKVETLQQIKQANPIDIELTLAMAKRFMAKQEYRIQLHDLIDAETQRALNRLNVICAAGEPTPAPPFVDLVTAREAAVEPLARLGTLLGRWGSGDELDSMIEAIKSIYFTAHRCRKGSFYWEGLVNYAAALVFYGYGLGLTRAGRWDVLHRLLNAPLVHDSYTERVGAILTPFFIESDCTNAWKELPGQSESETPLCNRLMEVLLPNWTATFAGVREAETIYEHFEMACVLAHAGFAEVTRAELKDRLKTGNFHYLVSGRMKWHAPSRKRLATTLSLDEHATPLLAGGFVEGDQEYLAAFIEGLQHHMEP